MCFLQKNFRIIKTKNTLMPCAVVRNLNPKITVLRTNIVIVLNQDNQSEKGAISKKYFSKVFNQSHAICHISY